MLKIMDILPIFNTVYAVYGIYWPNSCIIVLSFLSISYSITGLLKFQPNERMTITNLLQHPWLARQEGRSQKQSVARKLFLSVRIRVTVHILYCSRMKLSATFHLETLCLFPVIVILYTIALICICELIITNNGYL